MKNRRIAAFTAAVIALTGTGMLPAQYATPAYAEEASAETGKCGESAEYSIDNGVLTISGTGAMDDYEIITDYEGDVIPIVPPVDPATHSPFSNRSDIKKIVIEEGITAVGKSAFSGMQGVKEIVLPETLEVIGEGAFSLTTGFRSLTIPSSVHSIGFDALWGCTDMERLDLLSDRYDSTVFISNLPQETMTIGVIKDSGVETMVRTDANNPGRNIVYVDPSEKAESGKCGPTAEYTINRGVLTITGEGEISPYGSPLKETYDEKGEFAGRSDIHTIIVSEGITSIGVKAFSGMPAVRSVTLPESLTEIQSGAFADTEGLTAIVIPENVTSIDADAFYNCRDLKRIDLYAPGLKDIRFSEGIVKQAKTIGVVDMTETLYSLLGSIDPKEVRIIFLNEEAEPTQSGKCGESAEYTIDKNGILTITGSGPLYSYDIMDREGGLPVTPFKNRSDIHGIIIEDGITDIGAYTFYGMTGVRFIELPSELENIGESAFASTTGFSSIDIPKHIRSIGKEAFAGCEDLRKVHFHASRTEFEGAIDYLPSGIETITVPYRTQIEDLIRNDEFTKDKEIITYNAEDEEVKSYGECGDTLRYTIDAAGTLTISGYGAMYDFTTDVTQGSDQLPTPFFENKEIKKIVIKEGVTTVGDFAFTSCTEVTEIELPKTLTSIGEQPFFNCSVLNRFVLPEGVESISDSALSGLPELKELEIRSISLKSADFLRPLDESIRITVLDNCGIMPLLDESERKYELLSRKGLIGDDVYFHIGTDGKLTVKGTGAMYDFPVVHRYSTESGEDGTWYTITPLDVLGNGRNVTEAVIEEGITHIGDHVLTDITSLEEIKGTRAQYEEASDEFYSELNYSKVKYTMTDAEEEPEYKAGDANCDGKVTLADALAILQYVANADKYPLTEEGIANADVFLRGDGITGMDAVSIQKYDTGMITELPETYMEKA